MGDQLNMWRAKIDEIEAKSNESGSETRKVRQRHITELKNKHAAAQAKLDEFIAAGAETWGDHKTAIWLAWNDLEGAFEDFEESRKESKQ